MCHVSKNFSELQHTAKVYAAIYTLKWKSIDSCEMKIPRGDSDSTESILLRECKHFRHKQKPLTESWRETEF